LLNAVTAEKILWTTESLGKEVAQCVIIPGKGSRAVLKVNDLRL
jgi:hypothetical protein